jgi:hypothetical protein
MKKFLMIATLIVALFLFVFYAPVSAGAKIMVIMLYIIFSIIITKEKRD